MWCGRRIPICSSGSWSWELQTTRKAVSMRTRTRREFRLWRGGGRPPLRWAKCTGKRFHFLTVKVDRRFCSSLNPLTGVHTSYQVYTNVKTNYPGVPKRWGGMILVRVVWVQWVLGTRALRLLLFFMFGGICFGCQNAVERFSDFLALGFGMCRVDSARASRRPCVLLP